VWAQPAVGGAVTGLLAIAAVVLFDVRGVTGDGYQTLSAALAGTLALRVMLALMVAKLVATVFCYSSGGAGGIFAPVLFIGGMLGGSFGHLDQLLLSHTDTSLGAFALVGMGAFFAAVIRAPITSVLIIFEMTGSYGLVLPLMIANSAAYMLARRARSTPIYEALLEQDGLALPRPPSAASTLSTFRVADAMTTEVTTLATDMTVSQALEQVQRLTFTMYPVVDAAQRLTGVVTEARLRRKLAQSAGDELVQALAQAEEHMTESQSLVDAVARMHEIGARQMVVVAESDPTRLVGMIAMSDIVRAHALAVNGAHAPPRETSGGTPVRTVRPAVSWPERSSITGKDHAGRRD
jgi:CIC family chloride channel protein